VFPHGAIPGLRCRVLSSESLCRGPCSKLPFLALSLDAFKVDGVTARLEAQKGWRPILASGEVQNDLVP
jgi:hypothetical protein